MADVRGGLQAILLRQIIAYLGSEETSHRPGITLSSGELLKGHLRTEGGSVVRIGHLKISTEKLGVWGKITESF